MQLRRQFYRSLFPLLFGYNVFFFGVRCQTFWETSFQIGKRRDNTRRDSKLPSHIYVSGRRSLFLISPSASEEFTPNLRLAKLIEAESTNSFSRIRRETSSNLAHTVPIHSTSTVATAFHGCLHRIIGFTWDYRRDSVCWGLSSQEYH